jgi:predicted DNA-binding transcriptional regulator AlpA
MIMSKYKPHALREKDALHYLSIGRTKFRELQKDGLLPLPYYIGGCCFWKTTELENAFDKLIGAANDNEVQIISGWEDVVDGEPAR